MNFKNKLLSTLAIMVFSLPIFAQTNLDTIKLNKDLTATLEFDNPIKFIVLGNNPTISVTPDGTPLYKFYDIFQDDNIAIFKLKSIDAPFTTIDIKLENGVLYHGYICFSNQVTKTLYSFQNTNQKTTKQASQELDSTNAASSSFNQKFDKMRNMKHDIEDIALINNGITYQVVNMINDKEYMYIRVLLNNETSNLYIVDGVTFKMTEGKKKTGKKKEIVNQNWLSPSQTEYPTNKEIKAYSKNYIFFAVPMYSISTGNLTIKVLEKNGNRTGDIVVPADYLNSSKVF